MTENDNTRRSPLTDDPRIPMAAERTHLAWVRTGLALMGFGFVVARFGLFLQEMASVGHTPLASHGFSMRLGVGLLLLGVLVNILSAWKYRRYLKRLAEGVVPAPDPRMEVALAVILAGVGVATAAYLLWLG